MKRLPLLLAPLSLIALAAPAHAVTGTEPQQLSTKVIRANLNNTAIYEEVYFIDNKRYTSGKKGLGKLGWKATKGFSVSFHLKGKGKHASYCLEGWSGTSKHYVYKSTKGKITGVGTCG